MDNYSFSRRISREVRGHLAKAGMSQAKAASALGLSQPSFSRRLSGRTPFTVGELNQLALLLDVTVATLIGEVTP